MKKGGRMHLSPFFVAQPMPGSADALHCALVATDAAATRAEAPLRCIVRAVDRGHLALGALVLNMVIAINHRRDRYVA